MDLVSFLCGYFSGWALFVATMIILAVGRKLRARDPIDRIPRAQEIAQLYESIDRDRKSR